MKIAITGICGYVGSRFAARFLERLPRAEVFGIDNLSRRGSEFNKTSLAKQGVAVIIGDVRKKQDMAKLPKADWVIDCAAFTEVMAGTAKSECTSEALVDNNLVGTLNTLEYAKKHSAGFVLLSTSRVYSIEALLRIPLRASEQRFDIDAAVKTPLTGLSAAGIAETFSTDAPISLYGATKRASEIMALEYAAAFGLPVWINRCGVIGGPGQMGKIDQGIFSFWVYSCLLGKELAYIGFNGSGKQVRDVVLAEDVADLVIKQLQDPLRRVERIVNVGGGLAGSLSLRELTAACEEYFKRKITVESLREERQYDIPYYVSDTAKVNAIWNWQPSTGALEIVRRIAAWATENKGFIQELFQ